MKMTIGNFFDIMENNIVGLRFKITFYDSQLKTNIKTIECGNEDIEGFRSVFGNWLSVKSISFEEGIIKTVIDFRDISSPLNKVTIRDFCEVYEGNIDKFYIKDRTYTPIEANEKCGDQIIGRFMPIVFDNLIVFRIESESEQ